MVRHQRSRFAPRPAFAFAMSMMLVGGCGSLDNAPLRLGVIRGQLANADGSALVAIRGREDLVTSPERDGHFELKNVPVGSVELFIIVNAGESQRLIVDVGAASVTELGTVTAARSATFEVYVVAPGGQLVSSGTLALVGVPLTAAIRPQEGEAHLRVPAGCFDVVVSVPGLGSSGASGCVDAGGLLERRIALPIPDGTPGREGCPVTGCQAPLACQADLACR